MMEDSREGKAVDYTRRGVNRERLEAILAHAGKEILDVGCGSGAYVLNLSTRCSIKGIDYRGFDSWSQSPELFTIGDAASLPFVDNSVDTVLSFETLEHLRDPGKALNEYFRVCRKNLILTVPECTPVPAMRASGVTHYHWVDRTHVQFWTLSSIAELVEKTGFRIEVRQHINSVNLGFLVMDSLGLRGFAARIGAAIFGRLQRRKYPMTCLLVAAKPSQALPSER